MAKLTMVQAINLALHQEMEKDDRVLVMGEDVGVNGGVFRVTEGIHQKFGAARALDTPLAESGIMGAAIGMAIAGLRPVAEMQFDGFAYIALPQLEGHGARMRNRSRGMFTVPLVLRIPYGGGIRALEHHSESPETMWSHIPGVKTVVPSGPRNARAMLVAAIRDPDPVVYLEPKRSYRAFKEEVPDEEEVLEIGKAQVAVEGTDVTLVTWGAMIPPAMEVVGALRDQGVKVELIDLLTIAPMDAETIAASVRKTGRCVVVQEAHRTLGPASEVIALVNDRALEFLQAPVKRVTGYDLTLPYFAREHDYIPNAHRIRWGIEETLAYR